MLNHRPRLVTPLVDRHGRLHGWLLPLGASELEDRRRELVLNRLLLTSLLLAILLATQRTIQISHGGPDVTDHLHTLTVAVLAAVALGLLLWRSRHRDPTAAAWGLLALYYCLGAWSSFSEGPAKSFTILFWVLLVIAAAILGGARTAGVGTALAAATLTAATIVHATHLIGASAETAAQTPAR